MDIEDTGEGISANKIDTIFNSFTQGEGQLARKHQGIGIGLTLCQHFIKLLGGKIKINSYGN